MPPTSWTVRVVALLAALGAVPVWADTRPVTQYEYDPNGNLTRSTDALGRATQQTYDALDRLRTITQPPPDAVQPNPVIQQVPDGLDQVTAITDPRKLTTQYTVDGLGNLLQLKSPDTGTTVQTFDAAGNVLTRRDTRGKTTTYQYDALNRVTSIQYADGTTTLFGYDEGSNGLGRLTSVTDPDGSRTDWTYDAQGRVLTRSQASGSSTQTVAYQYEAATGRLTAITYPSGKLLSFTYDTQTKDVSALQLDGKSIANGIAFHPFGGVKTLTLGNNVPWTNTLDQDGRIVSYTLGSATYSVTWDAANRIVAITQPTDANANRNFSYDDLDRIIGLDTASQDQTFAYDLTGNLKQKRDVRNSTTLATDFTIDTASNRLLGSTIQPYTLDAVGNLINDGFNAFTYDDRNRLAAVNNAQGRTVYRLNGLGQRTSKSRSDGTRVDFLYGDSGELLAETDAQGAPLNEYLWLGGLPLAVVNSDQDDDGIGDRADNCVFAANPNQRDSDRDGHGNLCDADFDNNGVVSTPDLARFRRSFFSRTDAEADLNGDGVVNTVDLALFRKLFGKTVGASGTKGQAPVPVVRYVYTDHLQTPRALADAVGKIVWRWDSAPYGDTPANDDPDGDGVKVAFNLRFPGQYFDRETGLHYNGFRDYDPRVGRYVQSDPIGLRGGINTYGYTGGNPLIFIDSDGRFMQVVA